MTLVHTVGGVIVQAGRRSIVVASGQDEVVAGVRDRVTSGRGRRKASAAVGSRLFTLA